MAKQWVPICLPVEVLAFRQVCRETIQLTPEIIPSEQLHGNVMGDNWRLEFETAAQEFLNTQRCGCWSVKADFKLASVSWKKLFTVYFAVTGKYCLFNWLIKSHPDGSLISCLYSQLIGRGVLQKLILFVQFLEKKKKTSVLISHLQLSSRNI